MRFPPIKERFEQLEEILQVAHHMWRGDTSPYEGKLFQIPYPVNNPQPLSKPHPPILIGGMGPQKTLRFVAKYGDACNLFGGAEDTLLKERLEILQGHCANLGRPYDEIEKTVLQTADFKEGSNPAEVIARGKALAAMGFEHIIFNIDGLYSPENLKAFTDEIIPALKE
jgi:alkanesulfonate monooxygenase SsuD/methylene tetrahydromethanopterin reductase-like flavin-dependent oxidoreductase (luciferase family)